jgi:hypothetical protein
MRVRGQATTRGSIGKWMWHCPYPDCDAHGLRVQSYGRASRHGRNHLRRKHNDTHSKPEMEKME